MTFRHHTTDSSVFSNNGASPAAKAARSAGRSGGVTNYGAFRAGVLIHSSKLVSIHRNRITQAEQCIPNLAGTEILDRSKDVDASISGLSIVECFRALVTRKCSVSRLALPFSGPQQYRSLLAIGTLQHSPDWIDSKSICAPTKLVCRCRVAAANDFHEKTVLQERSRNTHTYRQPALS